MTEGGSALRAGVAGATITPDRPLYLEGYGGRTGPATGTLDPLEARAIVFEDGGTRAGIVTVDLCGLTATSVQRIRDVAEAACGIPQENVLVTYSHTHSAPLATPYLGAPVDADYLAGLEDTLGRLVAEAARQTRPATLAAGVGAMDFNVNRRLRTPNGVMLRPNPHGPVDRRVPVLRLDPADAPVPPGTLGGRALPQSDPIAVLFGYVCHPTVKGADNHRYSGDYPGVARRFVERAYRSDAVEAASLAFFLPGCFGDVRPHLVNAEGRFRPGTDHELLALGRQLGGEAVRVAESLAGEPVASIGIARRAVRLPYARVADAAELRAALTGPRRYWAEALLDRIEREGKLPEAETSEVQVLRLGRHWTVATPGETVLEIGLAIERGLAELGLARPERGDLVVTVGYANDYVAYLCSASLLTEGGYEPDSWFEYLRCGPFAPEIESVLVGTALALAAEIGPG
jgi:neutral ceramidase